MNISSEISSIYQSNSSGYVFSNDTEVETYFEMSSIVYIMCILSSFPINSYVIWLIVRGTGNGLAAEFFILNLSVCEILVSIELVMICLTYTFQISWTLVAFIDGLSVAGCPLFQCLICVERYLAVVHPVTFLKCKPLRYRLMCSAVVWMTAFASGGFNVIMLLFIFELYIIFLIVLFVVFFSIQLFCCVAVLRALKQSGPGEREREREEENHMKRRAFHLILITTVSILIAYIPFFVLSTLISLDNIQRVMCIGTLSFTLAGLMQPVLFIFRVGKMNFMCNLCN